MSFSPPSRAGSLVHAALDLLFPPRCLTCGALAPPFCDACRAEIRPAPEPLPAPYPAAALHCVGLHGGSLRRAVLRLKYDHRTALAAPLAGLLAEALARTGVPPADGIVPVPLHWTRRLERGFNQSELLAARLARHLGVPVVPALRRLRPTRAQARLGAGARAQNVAGAFRARTGALPGPALLLVDDVCTTGGTLVACAEALLSAGARRVTAVTVTYDMPGMPPEPPFP